MARTRILASGAFALAAALYAVLGLTLLGGVRAEMVSGVVLAFAASGAVVGLWSGARLFMVETGIGVALVGALTAFGAAFLFAAAALTWAAFTQGFTSIQVDTLPLTLLFVVLAATPAVPFGTAAAWGVWSVVRKEKACAVLA